MCILFIDKWFGEECIRSVLDGGVCILCGNGFFFVYDYFFLFKCFYFGLFFKCYFWICNWFFGVWLLYWMFNILLFIFER